VSTKELRRAYDAAVRERLESSGYVWRAQQLRWPTPAGTATFVVAVAATYGRLRTQVHLELVHDGFEELVQQVLGSSTDLLPAFTSSRNLSDLTHAEWLDMRLEVCEVEDIEPVVDTLGRHAERTAPSYWASIQSLGAICTEPGLPLQRGPLALHLLGRDDEVEALLAGWETDPAQRWLEPLVAPYRAGLGATTDRREQVAADLADHVPFDRRLGR